jgi:hypothetical protein
VASGGDEQAPDLVLVDDLDTELLGFGGLARADAGAWTVQWAGRIHSRRASFLMPLMEDWWQILCKVRQSKV